VKKRHVVKYGADMRVVRLMSVCFPSRLAALRGVRGLLHFGFDFGVRLYIACLDQVRRAIYHVVLWIWCLGSRIVIDF
jgi:hypothetical protein